MTATKCAGTTQAGNPCRRNALDHGYCNSHADLAAPVGNSNADTHIMVNAIGNYILGGLTLAFSLFAGMFMWFGSGALAEFMSNYYEPVAEFLASSGAVIGMMVILFGLLIGIPQVLAGAGLTKRTESGRILGLVAAAFHVLIGLTLFSGNIFAIVNLGFGGYAFYSLLQPDVAAQFKA